MVESQEGVDMMGGPWKSRDFDAQSWRPPLPPVEARVESLPGRAVSEAAVVAAYVMSVVAGIVVMLAAMKQGW
jgi:hypothetical protein